MKQQQLIFDKGITNTPSDAVCSDNALQECLNLYYREGEYRPIQSPQLYMTDAPHLLFVDRLNDETRFITKDGNDIKWGTRDTSDPDNPVYSPARDDEQTEIVLLTASGDVTVQSVGKTLVITDDDGMHFFLWKKNAYTKLNNLPSLDVEFKLFDGGYGHPAKKDNSAGSEADITGIVELYGSRDPQDYQVVEGKEDDWNNAVLGAYAECKDKAAKVKRFSRPFYARAALQLYDDSYTMITNPVLLVPNVAHNMIASIHTQGTKLFCSLFSCCLAFKVKTDYSDYRDIVKNISIFVSSEIETIDTGEAILNVSTTTRKSIYAHTQRSSLLRPSVFESVNMGDGWDQRLTRYSAYVQKELDDSEVNYRLSTASVFYKMFDVQPVMSDYFIDSREFVLPSTMENITTQEQLPEDDYFSRSLIIPRFVQAYNARLNLASVNRGFFEGFHHFMPYDNVNNDAPSMHYYDFYVTIESDSETIVVKHEVQTSEKQGLYFYYPDARAKHVVIHRNDMSDGWILDEDLTEHQHLHGAYYFAGLPKAEYTETYIGHTPDSKYITVTPNPVEPLPNYIIQSEVDNPFIFPASGYHRVGTGKIVGMSPITQALSEGQYGQFPMLVFSESGIWSLDVNSEGLYTTATPMSREVPIISNPSVTQTDGAIFFLSEKGLMMIVGSNVQCMSRQLSGRTDDATDRLDITLIAYDYRDSLLWIFTQHGGNRCYIYNIKEGTFSRKTIGSRASANRIYNVVNMYPDTLMQFTGGDVVSLLHRPNINDDTDTYAATIRTRPMKLENAFALKTILQTRHIYQFADEGRLSLRIFASNNLRSWVELHSLHGTPWKYYRFEYTFAALKATDTFAGTVIITEERRSNRLR